MINVCEKGETPLFNIPFDHNLHARIIHLSLYSEILEIYLIAVVYTYISLVYESPVKLLSIIYF